MVGAGGRDGDQLVGTVDHPAPHGVGFVVAGVDDDEPVITSGDFVCVCVYVRPSVRIQLLGIKDMLEI